MMNRIKPSFLACLGFLMAALSVQAIETQALRCEYLKDPLGIDAINPRLSWTLSSDERGDGQTSYQILVASSPELLAADKGDLWDSGQVKSDESTQIVYEGQPLVAREDCFWKVRAWDAAGRRGEWSAPARWQMGLLQKSDWTAQWIIAPPDTDTNHVLEIQRAIYEPVNGSNSVDVTVKLQGQVTQGHLKMKVDNGTMGGDPASNVTKHLRVEYRCDGESFTNILTENTWLVLPADLDGPPYLRKSFTVTGPVKRAILYATALGLYEARINGRRVGDHVLAPDWTDYRQRVRYQAYDVTALLQTGDNVMGAMLANGWFSGHIGNGGFEFFGKEPAFLAQLEITHADGSTERIGTDASWKFHPGPILAADFMQGEKYDACKEIAGWDKPGLDDNAWPAAQTRDESALKLEAQVMEPVRELMELKPKSVKETTPGHWTYDLGQNMVGVVRLKVSAPAGTKITIRHAEMLNPDGTIYTANLRGAPSIDEYTCKGDDVETWQPRFTFHGFRYVEIGGLTNAPDLNAVTGIVIGTDNPQTGTFACSDPRLNQLQSNIQWGQRGNYLSVPTDCPQRDERLGWMGDAEVFIRTATYNADVAAFFNKWLVDVDDGQSAAGAFANVSPNTSHDVGGVPAWGDAGVICPWTIYQAYGDTRILEQHLPAMAKYIEYMRAHSHGLIRDTDRGEDFGDWLSINADTPKDLIGTAFFAYSTHLVAKSYLAVGDKAEAKKYDRLFEDIKKAFNQRYVSADGHIKGDTQCAYAMALKFELLPEKMRAKVADRLVANIRAKGNHLSTGFVGVSYLLPVLAQSGHADVAYDLLQQDTFPSWLFSVKHGATTIWERWDGWTPDKGFQDPGMNSFNHYSLGSCGEFLFGGIGGIRPASAGFKTIRIEPVIRDGLTWADTSFDSIHGKISTAWKRYGDRVTLQVTIPVNTTATVCIPTAEKADITEAGNPLSKSKWVKHIKRVGETTEVEIESGTYEFAWKAPISKQTLLKKGDRLAICGDSITEQKRYSRIMEDYLTACVPQLDIQVRQLGWGGERADGFLARMTNDCLRFKPTIATTSYGMNDHGSKPYEPAIGDAYRSNMLGIIHAFQANDVRVVVGSPGTIAKVPWWEAGKYQLDDLNQNLGRLRDIDFELSRQEKTGFADVYETMRTSGIAAKQKYGERYQLNGDDGIHPDWAGHTVMAYAFLKGLGLDGGIADFTLDLSANKLTVSDGHELLSAKDGVFTIRSRRYPFCPDAPMGMAADWYPTIGFNSPTNSDNLRSGMTLVPFNEELNRFMLTVRNAKAGKYRVTWGDQSREFCAEQLGEGVNLAAEFDGNPFSTRFAMIDAAVAGKQEFETRETKTLFRVPGEKVTMQQVTEQTDRMVKDAERERDALEAAIRAAYAPVTYTLTVRPE